MPKAVIEDWDQFIAFLAAQPFCQCAAQKQRDLAAEKHNLHGQTGIRHPPPKNDNADLAAALSSMA